MKNLIKKVLVSSLITTMLGAGTPIQAVNIKDQMNLKLNFEFTTDPQFTILDFIVDNEQHVQDIQSECSTEECNHSLDVALEKGFNLNELDFDIAYLQDGQKYSLDLNNDTVTKIVDHKDLHLLNRITFGRSEADFEALHTAGLNAYLETQLNPSSIEEEQVFKESIYTTTVPESIEELRKQMIYKAINSKKQLNEMMTWFWERHFNDNYDKIRNIRNWKYPWNHNRSRIKDYRSSNEFIKGKAIAAGGEFYIDDKRLEQIDITAYDQVQITMSVGDSIGTNQAKLFIGEDKSGTREYAISFDTINDNEQHTYNVNMYNTTTFEGENFDIEDCVCYLNKNANGESFWTAHGTINGLKIVPVSADLPEGVEEVEFKITEIKLISSLGVKPEMSLLFNHVANEYDENQFFRANALGNFKDLLRHNSKSANMLLYLDNFVSNKEDPNENYARELLELHTLGVNNYTAADIEALAEIFTGWTSYDSFYFNAAAHEFAEHELTFSEENIATGGVEQGEKVIDILAEHPLTGQRICNKLIELFLGFKAEPGYLGLQTSCADTFVNEKDSPSQLAEVVRHILNSGEFLATSNYKQKINSPLNFFTTINRKLDINYPEDYSDGMVRWTIPDYFARDNYYPIFDYPPPTGLSEASYDWFSSGQLLKRINITKSILDQRAIQDKLVARARAQTDGTKEGIARYFMDLFIGHDSYTDEEVQGAVAIFDENFALDNDGRARSGLRDLLRYIIIMPKSQMN